MTMASETTATTLPSQELFDETVLENEECFDLSPDDALRETIDQFCQQLGVVFDASNDDAAAAARTAASSSLVGHEEGDGTAAIPSPTSVAASSCDKAIVASMPSELSHLILSHPNSSQGIRDRGNRRRFQNCLTLLDGCVGTDGTVNVKNEIENTNGTDDAAVTDDCSGGVLGALEEIGHRCKFGDAADPRGEGDVVSSSLSGDDNVSKTGSISNISSSPLPYLTILQRTSSIYTLMSFLSVLDPSKLSSINEHATISKEDAFSLQILTATAQTISSVLLNNPAKDDGKCVHLRSELRDSFVPALARLVRLVGGIVGSIQQLRADVNANATSIESLSSVLSDLLRLGTNATRGCEVAKVSWVQSTLPPESKLVGCHTKRGGVAVIVACLSMMKDANKDASNNNIIRQHQQLTTEACQLLASLCRFDDFRDPSSTSNNGAMGAAGVNTSSAHEHAMEFQRAGATISLIEIARHVVMPITSEGGSGGQEMADERLAASALTALRVLAVNDEIIQTMVALGVLPIVTEALRWASCVVTGSEEDCVQNSADRRRFAAASMGLLRNLCGNDEIKTNLCLGSGSSSSSSSTFQTSSVLPYLLRTMKQLLSTALVQEHGCGTLAAMALRRPANARAIMDAGGPRAVLSAMRRHDANVNVQRQGSLAIRNIASRILRDSNSDDSGVGSTANNGEDERGAVRDAFLELGAEEVLRNIAGRHQGSVDEAYAALRDLGCTVSLVKFSADDLQTATSRTTPGVVAGRTMMFGEKHNSNFRPVYEESTGLADGVDSAVSQFGT